MEWYKSLSLNKRINAKAVYEMACGIPFSALPSMFSFRQKIEILEFKLEQLGFDLSN